MNNVTLIDAFFINSKIEKFTRNLIIIFLGSLLLTISAKFKIDIPPVPITLQTLVVLVFSFSVGWKLALSTFSFYLFQGFIGLPVFANAPFGGPIYFIGPSAGYLFGMLLASFLLGYLAEKNYDKNYFKSLLILILGSIIIFTPGILYLGFWFNVLSPNAGSINLYQGYSNALTYGLLLFKFTEPVKIALAATITPLLWQYIKNK
jgi:biotin transport system substrate-specific component